MNTTAKVNTGSTGTIAITTRSGEPIEAFELGEILYIIVEDLDLRKLKGISVDDGESTDSEVHGSTPHHIEITVRCIVPEMQEVNMLN